MMNPVETTEMATWPSEAAAHSTGSAVELLECGKVLLMPRLGFTLTTRESELLSPACADGKSKNISYEPATRNLKGCSLTGDGQIALAGMIERFHHKARALIDALLPGYRLQLKNGLASFRPLEAEGRQTSVTKDDSRLHVDAFASRPNRGMRILRVFSNVNPGGNPRVWEVGEPFESIAQRYYRGVPRLWPASAWLLQALHITKGRRSEYDHIMLNLHDQMKRDTEYQKNAPRVRVEFPAGSTWVCFSDRVAHAALSGQYLLEQTFYLPVAAMQDERYSPLRILEKLYQRKLT